MQNRLMIIVSICVFFLMNGLLYAAQATTNRIPQYANDQVNVWETVIYPGNSQQLKMHRHDHNRVVVAFDDGLVKITNDQGKVHYLKFEKNKSYYLSKDAQGELHTDENMSSHPIKVLVVELKN